MKVFVDGNQGTTGLKIAGKLAARPDVQLLTLPEHLRKEPAARKEMILASDVTFLCLPDAAAVEAAELAGGKGRLIDASTAHRIDPGWTYGFPELGDFRARIAGGTRVAVPGCHAGGFAAIVKPLRDAGLLPADWPLVCHSLTGYSGGGKKMIAEYEAEGRSADLDAPRQYGLSQQHKHLREMTYVSKLSSPPCFSPIVADYYCGMEVSVPLFGDRLGLNKAQVLDCYRAAFAGSPVVSARTVEEAAADGFLAANRLAGIDRMEVLVGGCDERILVSALFDNLGKGASGAAVQCMNIMFGLDERLGLEL